MERAGSVGAIGAAAIPENGPFGLFHFKQSAQCRLLAPSVIRGTATIWSLLDKSGQGCALSGRLKPPLTAHV